MIIRNAISYKQINFDKTNNKNGFHKKFKNNSFFNQKHYLCSPKNLFNGKPFSNQERCSSKHKRNERNRYHGKTTRNAIRDLKVIDSKEAASEKIPAVSSMIDKLAKRGIIHKNKAANLKSKLTKDVNSLAK